MTKLTNYSSEVGAMINHLREGGVEDPLWLSWDDRTGLGFHVGTARLTSLSETSFSVLVADRNERAIRDSGFRGHKPVVYQVKDD